MSGQSQSSWWGLRHFQWHSVSASRESLPTMSISWWHLGEDLCFLPSFHRSSGAIRFNSEDKDECTDESAIGIRRRRSGLRRCFCAESAAQKGMASSYESPGGSAAGQPSRTHFAIHRSIGSSFSLFRSGLSQLSRSSLDSRRAAIKIDRRSQDA